MRIKYYDRTVTYSMVLENHKWVVDDIIYDEKHTSRKQMVGEIEQYAKPSPKN